MMDVRAHCYCASLLRTKIHVNERALSTKMNNDKADAVAIALLGFNDLESSVTPLFLFRNRFHLQ